MTDFFKSWNERIRRDLASFGDPGASVDVDGSGRSFRAAWTMRGEPREATFSLSLDQGVRVAARGARPTPYRTFVSGPDMADLRHVAQMIQSARRPRLYVPARAKYPAGPAASGSQDREGPAIEVLTGLLDEEADTTRVIMVTGGAGAGKTCVLRELVRRQAEAYLSGRTSRLLLYVNAQGRSLARLNEALATELQDLKVGLTYHSVAVLSQLGVLVPVIDGFDELLGVSGYDDAFGSLAGFLEQLRERAGFSRRPGRRTTKRSFSTGPDALRPPAIRRGPTYRSASRSGLTTIDGTTSTSGSRTKIGRGRRPKRFANA